MHSKIIFSINSHCSLNMKWLLFTINAPIKKIYDDIPYPVVKENKE